MAFLSDEEKKRIADTIRQVEEGTSGEFVTVIARESDDYYYIPIMWAALSGLLLPALVTLAGLQETLLGTYGAQIVMFFLCALLFRIPALKRLLIPGDVKRRRAKRLAWEQFYQQNLHHTEQRNGVLLFVSVAERYVEIIADKGINDVVPQGAWDQLVSDFVGQVKAGQVTEGFVQAIQACGQQLSEHFPASGKNPNELPNHLIEL